MILVAIDPRATSSAEGIFYSKLYAFPLRLISLDLPFHCTQSKFGTAIGIEGRTDWQFQVCPRKRTNANF